MYNATHVQGSDGAGSPMELVSAGVCVCARVCVCVCEREKESEREHAWMHNTAIGYIPYAAGIHPHPQHCVQHQALYWACVTLTTIGYVTIYRNNNYRIFNSKITKKTNLLVFFQLNVILFLPKITSWRGYKETNWSIRVNLILINRD